MSGARHGTITDADVAELRSRIGVERTIPQYNEFASADGIRHFAQGIGDDNPLWTNRDYAAHTRYGRLVAPPCFLSSCGMPRSIGMPGVHALYTGSDWHFERPVLEGERIETSVLLRALDEKQGDFAGRQFHEIDEAVYRTGDGEVVARLKSHCMRTDRSKARERGKYNKIEQHTYTDDELEAIGRAYDDEILRGAEPRYWDDVEVGADVPPIVKGPLTLTDMVGFLMGWGGMFVRPHGIGHRWRQRHPAAYTKDQLGVPDVPERVHWDNDAARAAGAPAAYDYGPQRIAWVAQVMTNWMGDDGFLTELSVEVRRFNLVGDTTWCSGSVTDKWRSDSGAPFVRCTLIATNQDSVVTATGHAVARLPARPGGG